MRVLEDPSRNATDGFETLAARARQRFLASWYPSWLPDDQLGAGKIKVGDFSSVSELMEAPSDLQKKHLRGVDESIARSIRLDVLQSARLSTIDYRSLATREEKRIIGTLLDQKNSRHQRRSARPIQGLSSCCLSPRAGSTYFENYNLFEDLAL